MFLIRLLCAENLLVIVNGPRPNGANSHVGVPVGIDHTLVRVCIAVFDCHKCFIPVKMLNIRSGVWHYTILAKQSCR